MSGELQASPSPSSNPKVCWLNRPREIPAICTLSVTLPRFLPPSRLNSKQAKFWNPRNCRDVRWRPKLKQSSTKLRLVLTTRMQFSVNVITSFLFHKKFIFYHHLFHEIWFFLFHSEILLFFIFRSHVLHKLQPYSVGSGLKLGSILSQQVSDFSSLVFITCGAWNWIFHWFGRKIIQRLAHIWAETCWNLALLIIWVE